MFFGHLAISRRCGLTSILLKKVLVPWLSRVSHVTSSYITWSCETIAFSSFLDHHHRPLFRGFAAVLSSLLSFNYGHVHFYILSSPFPPSLHSFIVHYVFYFPPVSFFLTLFDLSLPTAAARLGLYLHPSFSFIARFYPVFFSQTFYYLRLSTSPPYTIKTEACHGSRWEIHRRRQSFTCKNTALSTRTESTSLIV